MQALLSKCPFIGKSAGQAQHTVKTSGQCPFGFSRSTLNGADEVKQEQQEHTDGTRAVSANHNDPQAQLDQSSPPAVCPYGFSSAASAGPKLSELHCVLCKSFMFAATQTQPCQHKFCRLCISRFESCPVCGRDIENTENDVATQDTIDKVLAAHASLTKEQGHLNSNPASPVSSPQQPAVSLSPTHSSGLLLTSVPNPAASFFLRLGLQALRGGNPAAALGRLEQCKQELVAGCCQKTTSDTATSQVTNSPTSKQQDTATQCLVRTPIQLPPVCGDLGSHISLEVPAELPVEAACPLGAVFGSQGDACKQLGALQAAAALYAASAQCLQGAATAGDEEACHSWSVSVNKLGDVQYLAGDLAGAQQTYEQALAARKQRLQQATQTTTSQPAADDTAAATTATATTEGVLSRLDMSCLSQALDVVASLIKVADVTSAQGAQQAAQEAWQEADALLTQCEGLLQPPHDHAVEDSKVVHTSEQQHQDEAARSNVASAQFLKMERLRAALQQLHQSLQ